MSLKSEFLRIATATCALLCALALAGCVAVARLQEPAAPDDSMLRTGYVVRVVDGDTARIVIDGVEEKVRLIGVDTPESTNRTEPYGDEASAYAKAALTGRTVWVETDVELRDRYDRLLAYVWTSPPDTATSSAIADGMFNARLVADGYAQIYTFPPNVKYQQVFLELQREAREAGRGLWSVPGAADPLEGRRAEEPVY